MLFLSFVLESLYVETRPATHQKPFIFDHLVQCSVGFDSSATSDRRVHARGGARGQNLEHLRFFFSFAFFSFAFFSCMELFVFEQQVLFRIDSLCDPQP